MKPLSIKKEKILFLLTLILTLIIISLVWHKLPSQDSQTYLNFADQLNFIGIPHFFDVFSNFSFLIVGCAGLNKFTKLKKSSLSFMIIGSVLSTSIILTSFGSSYFHWNPNLNTLVWDRLPMTIGFMSIVAFITADRVHEKLGLYSLIPLIPIGFFSVLGYSYGYFNLRPYASIQLGSILFVALTTLIQKEKKIKNSMIAGAVLFYFIAKVFETYDHAFYHLSRQIISGHTLKHLLAAIAIAFIFKSYSDKSIDKN